MYHLKYLRFSKTKYNAVVSFKNKQKQTKYHLFFTCHEIRDWEQLNLILPCFDRSSSDFPIAKGKGRKIRNGRGVNPGQGQETEEGHVDQGQSRGHASRGHVLGHVSEGHARDHFPGQQDGNQGQGHAEDNADLEVDPG